MNNLEMPTCYMEEDVVCRKEEKEKENGQDGAQRINKPAEKIKIVIAVSRISFWGEGWQEGALCRRISGL